LVARFHIDTDFLVYALATSGPERIDFSGVEGLRVEKPEGD
jgi:hypothetical protein